MDERIEVAIEGVPTVDGRLIEAGALDFLPGPVPVTGAPDRTLLGMAARFERDERGYISCEVRLLKNRKIPAGYAGHIDVTDAEVDQVGELLVVRKGTLRAVYLSDGPWGWSHARVR